MEEESHGVIPNEDIEMSEEEEENEEEKDEEKNAIASIDGTRDYAPNKVVNQVLPVNQRGLKDSELVDYLKRAEIVPMMPKQWDSNISTTPSLHIPVPPARCAGDNPGTDCAAEETHVTNTGSVAPGV